jgi:hypothetical protein
MKPLIRHHGHVLEPDRVPRTSGQNGIHRANTPVPENTVNSVKRDVATPQERSKR